jgi:hypothetical protein
MSPSIWIELDPGGYVMTRSRRVYSVGLDDDGTWYMEHWVLGHVRDAVKISGYANERAAKAEAIRIENEYKARTTTQ